MSMVIMVDLTESQLRRIVDGAIRDAMRSHPDYFTARGRLKAKNGIGKRVTGTLKGFAAQTAEGSAVTRLSAAG